MTTKDYLQVLRNEIHSTVMATVDDDGHPVTRVIDVMLVDDNTFYFLTAKGKEFYRQLTEQKYIALSGMTGGEGMDVKEASLHKKAISIRGKIESIGAEKLDEIFEANPYMAAIYPEPETRQALEVFKMTDGVGEFFDLSTKPITRGEFLVGDRAAEGLDGNDSQSGPPHGGYFITDQCVGCQSCVRVCPQKCIITTSIPLVIEQEHCLHCGNCYTACPYGAVERRD